jgi:hypothetical protein
MAAFQRPARMRGPYIPNLNEVRNYIEEQGLNVDAESFMDYYGARGWYITPRMPLMDFRAMLRQWNRIGYSSKVKKVGAPLEQFASLGALQIQLKEVEAQLTEILFPGGAAFKTEPTGTQRVRYDQLMAQRKSLKERIAKF